MELFHFYLLQHAVGFLRAGNIVCFALYYVSIPHSKLQGLKTCLLNESKYLVDILSSDTR